MAVLDRKPLLRNRVEEELRRLIASGQFQSGDRMPSEVEMAAEFSCNRQTLRFALEELEADGMIERRRGSGTYITALPQTSADAPMVAILIATTGDVYEERSRLIVGRMQEEGLVPTVFDMGAHRPAGELRLVLDRLHRLGCRRLLLQTQNGPLVDYLRQETANYEQIVWISEGTALQADLAGDLVALDFSYGFTQILRHLQQTGRRSVALVCLQPVPGFSYHYLTGFNHAVRLLGGWESTEILTSPRNVTNEIRMASMVERLKAPDRPAAMVCMSDWEAVLVLRAAEQAGLRVSEDLAVTGCGATPWSEEYGITTLSNENEEFADAAVELLQQHWHASRRHAIWLRPSLILNHSTS